MQACLHTMARVWEAEGSRLPPVHSIGINAMPEPYQVPTSAHPMHVNSVSTILIREHLCPVRQHVHHTNHRLQPTAVTHTIIGSLLKLERKSDSSLSLKSVANLPVPLILNVVGNGVFRTSMNSSHCPSGTTPCFL